MQRKETNVTEVFTDQEEGSGLSEEYACPVPDCGKRIRSRSGFYNHRDTHLETEIYACPVPGCGRSFRSRSSYYYHKKIHFEIEKDVCTKPGATDQQKNAFWNVVM